VWKKRSDGSEEVYFYSVSGQRLGIFEVYSPYATLLQFRQKETRIYFGGRPVTTRDVNDTTTPAYPDRLGSLGSYFPYGEERTTTANDKDKFATYYRDGTTGLDYAMNRYYSSQYGRFVTPDPYQASGGVANPGSWNRYAYVEGDPVNSLDPLGLKTYRVCIWGRQGEDLENSFYECWFVSTASPGDLGGGGGGSTAGGPQPLLYVQNHTKEGEKYHSHYPDRIPLGGDRSGRPEGQVHLCASTKCNCYLSGPPQDSLNIRPQPQPMLISTETGEIS